MTEKTRDILRLMMNQFRSNHNDERATALEEVLNENQAWISCADNPPKTDKEVLFTRTHNGKTMVRIGKMDHLGRNGYGYFHSKEGRYIRKYKCRVWMPLPEPYIDNDNDSDVDINEW